MLSEGCAPLQDLFEGPSGLVSIGRLISTSGSGREVFLRRVSPLTAEALARDVHAASLVAHPSVLKLLGLSQQSGSTNLYMVSEFIVGASLLQIVAAARHCGRPLPGGVCLKLVHDALLAAFEARRILSENSQWRIRRTIFHDTVWVTDFGATLLSEVGISERLHGPDHAIADHAHPDLDGDVLAAGAALRCMASDEAGQLALSAAHRKAVSSLLARSEAMTAERFEEPREMALAIAALPQDLVAHESEVGRHVDELMRPALALQRARLGLVTEAGQVDTADDGATRVFSTSELVKRSERPTQRPPDIAPVSNPGRAVIQSPKITSETLDRAAAASVAGANASDFGSYAGEMTQIFVPVFGTHGPEQAHPASQRSQAPERIVSASAGISAWRPQSLHEESSGPARGELGSQRSFARLKRTALLVVAITAAVLLLWWRTAS